MPIDIIERFRKAGAGGTVDVSMVVKIASVAPGANDKVSGLEQLFLDKSDYTLYYHSGTSSHDWQTLKRADRWRGSYDATNGTYAVGDLVVQSSTIYICHTAISTAETFTSSKWYDLSTDTDTTYAAGNGLDLSGTTFSIDTDGTTLSSGSDGVKVADNGITSSQIADDATYPDVKRIITAGSNITVTPSDTGKTITLAATTGGQGSDAWKGTYSSSSSYSAGDMVLYDGAIFVNTTAIASPGETWNASKWQRAGTRYRGAYDATNGTYFVGDIVVQASGIYLCKTAITTAETFTSSKWYHLTAEAAGLTIQEEGSTLTTKATTLNFIGGKITAAGNGATKTITVAGFDIHNDLSTELSTLADSDRFAASDESATGDPTNYVQAVSIYNYIKTKQGTGGSHTRWVGISTDATFTADELTSSSTTEVVTIPTFSTNSYIALAVPNTEGDITGFTQQGTSVNQLGEFTKASGTLTKSSIAYKYWVSNTVLYPVLSGTKWVISQ